MEEYERLRDKHESRELPVAAEEDHKRPGPQRQPHHGKVLG